MSEAVGRIDLSTIDMNDEGTRNRAGDILDELETQDQLDQLRGRTNADSTNRPDATGDTGNGSDNQRAGFDTVMRYLRENESDIPGGAAAMLELQQSVSRTGNRSSEADRLNSELRERLANLEGRLSSTTEGASETDPELDKLKGSISARDRQIFGLLKEDAGLLSKEEWQSSAQSQREQEISQAEAAEGIKMYGNHFGDVVNGKFEWNPDVRDQVENQISYLTEDVGVTPLAAYRLTFFDKLLDAAYQKGKIDRIQSDDDEVGKRLHSTTMTRGGGGRGASPAIYKQGDKAEDVLDRSFLIAKQKQNRRPV